MKIIQKSVKLIQKSGNLIQKNFFRETHTKIDESGNLIQNWGNLIQKGLNLIQKKIIFFDFFEKLVNSVKFEGDKDLNYFEFRKISSKQNKGESKIVKEKSLKVLNDTGANMILNYKNKYAI